MRVLGYLLKLKMSLGITFGGHPLYDFFFNTLSIDRVSISYLFPSQDIKQNVLLNSYSDN